MLLSPIFSSFSKKNLFLVPSMDSFFFLISIYMFFINKVASDTIYLNMYVCFTVWKEYKDGAV